LYFSQDALSFFSTLKSDKKQPQNCTCLHLSGTSISVKMIFHYAFNHANKGLYRIIWLTLVVRNHYR
jgi:hypothetical protein